MNDTQREPGVYYNSDDSIDFVSSDAPKYEEWDCVINVDAYKAWFEKPNHTFIHPDEYYRHGVVIGAYELGDELWYSVRFGEAGTNEGITLASIPAGFVEVIKQ